MNSFAILFCVACVLAFALIETIAILVVVVYESRRVMKSLTKEQREKLKKGEALWEK